MLWAEHVARNTARDRDDVYAEVARHFDDAELVELTGVSGLFGLSNRFQDTLHLPIEEQSEVDRIRQSVRADPERIRTYLQRLVEAWPAAHADAFSPRALSAGSDGAAAQAGARVPLPDAKDAPVDAASFLRSAGELLGGLPNAVRVWAHVPHVGKLLLPFRLVLERAGAGSMLPEVVRILARLRTSRENRADYSMAHAMALGREAGVPEGKLAAAAGEEGTGDALAPPEQAALAWATEIASNSARRRNDLFAGLRGHYSDAEIVELTGICAMANMTDRINNALRVPLEPGAQIAALNRPARIRSGAIRVYLERVLADWPSTFPLPR